MYTVLAIVYYDVVYFSIGSVGLIDGKSLFTLQRRLGNINSEGGKQ